MGVRNYLVEGISGSGKTTVATELARRGHHVVHGDRELAYQGDPVTGQPLPGAVHEHHVWDLDRVRELVADRSHPVTFLCGGSRNHARFVDLLDGVLVLEVDRTTLERRLDARPDDEYGSSPRRTGPRAAAPRHPRGPADRHRRRRDPTAGRGRRRGGAARGGLRLSQPGRVPRSP